MSQYFGDRPSPKHRIRPDLIKEEHRYTSSNCGCAQAASGLQGFISQAIRYLKQGKAYRGRVKQSLQDAGQFLQLVKQRCPFPPSDYNEIFGFYKQGSHSFHNGDWVQLESDVNRIAWALTKALNSCSP